MNLNTKLVIIMLTLLLLTMLTLFALNQMSQTKLVQRNSGKFDRNFRNPPEEC